MNDSYTIIWSFRNRIDVLLNSIASAHKLTPKEVNFCLVDASSDEDTIKKLRDYCNLICDRKIRICESDYRTNLSEDWNLGMMLTDSRYVIFSSSDVEFTSDQWFHKLKTTHEQQNGQYILMENHAVFLIDKTIIPRIGWFDEKYIPGPHFDCDYMIKASEKNIPVVIISNDGCYTHGDTPEESIQRSSTEVKDRLPMHHLHNEEYFKKKWLTSWPGWKNYLDKADKPHPPTHITQVKRLENEIDFHPNYTNKYRK